MEQIDEIAGGDGGGRGVRVAPRGALWSRVSPANSLGGLRMRKLSLLAFTLLLAALPAWRPSRTRSTSTTWSRCSGSRTRSRRRRGTGSPSSLRTTDLEANRGRTDLWLVNADGGGLTRLTDDPASDDNPRWAPDGKSLYFLSTRSGSSQVWRLPIGRRRRGRSGAGHPSAARRRRTSPSRPTARGSPSAWRSTPTARRSPAPRSGSTPRRRSKSTGQLFQGDGGFVRHWDTWSAGLRTHLFVLPAGPRGARSGRPHAGDERRRPLAALRRRRGVHLLAGRPDRRLRRPRRRPRGALVHQLRPLPRAGGRLGGAPRT